MSAKAARITATATCFGYVGLLAAFDQIPTGPVKQLLTGLPVLVGLLAVAFDLLLWRLSVVRLVVGRPRVYGTWKAVLTPSQDSHIPDGGNRGPIEAYVIIAQTYWTLHVTLHTKESSSRSTAATLKDIGGKQQSLAYVYDNTPRQEHQPRSTQHAGAGRFTVVDNGPEEMSGDYWTSRLTRGDLDLVLVDRKTKRPTFRAAQQAAESTAAKAHAKQRSKSGATA